MRTLLVGLMAFCTAFGAIAWGQGPPRGRGGASGWLSSLSEGKAEAKRTGKPLMVVVRCEP
jgi:hypothetical protein